ncbi:MAG TPA: dimethylarginine dimethylaminohydrolase family protein [Candidatus Eremiobacteraceae bacterium]|nr:dimethylarginine dimethylaminohydrolase family protein [Candidatus Eremiobacteraceae bacterium]
MTDPRYFLMCKPTHFGVSYVINPWMKGNIAKTSLDRATSQWRDLLRALTKHARIELVEPEPGLPDMVFTANAGFVYDDVAIVSRFRHPERQGEEPHFERWFRSRRYQVFTMPSNMPFEGAGDALIDRAHARIWAAWGHRSARSSHALISMRLGVEVVSLRLVDPRFYHLDTCFCPLEGGPIMYFPAAFDARSNRIIERLVPRHARIAIEEEDALHFACNAVNIGTTIVMNKASRALRANLAALGYKLIETELTEFLKAGGAAKCLTLRLNEPRKGAAAVATRIA